MRCGVISQRIYEEFVPIVGDRKLEDVIVSLSNSTNAGGSVLVMGAAGKGDEGKAKPHAAGQPPIGSLALACIEHSKQPVVLVKSGQPPATEGRIPRVGADGTPGLNIMICIDPSPVSRKAFDMSLTLVTKGRDRKSDSLFMYHVQQPGDELLIQEYGQMPDKLKDEYKDVTFVVEPRRAGAEIKKMIEDFIDERKIDLVIMGSVELSKPGRNLGSVTQAVAKSSAAHVCVVKNFAYTW